MQSTTSNQPQTEDDVATDSVLWRLPQEMLDLIFGLAYPRKEHLKLILKSEWDLYECAKKRSDVKVYQIRPFPQRKFDDWMINKRFFLLAAAAWLGNQRFRNHTEGGRYRLISSFLIEKVGLFLDFAREIHDLSSWCLYNLNSCRNLKVLQVQLEEQSMEKKAEVGVGKLGWEDEFDDSDFAKLAIVSDLEGVQGLQHFSLRTAHQLFAKSPQQKAIWAKNVAALEDYLKRSVLARKSQSQPADERTSANTCRCLYSRSSVCMDCNQHVEEPHSELLRLFQAQSQFHEVGPALAEAVELDAGQRGQQQNLGDIDIPKEHLELLDMMRTQPLQIAGWNAPPESDYPEQAGMMESRSGHRQVAGLQVE